MPAPRNLDGLLTVNASGLQVTTGAASAVAAIPSAADGNRARFVLVQSKANAYVRPGTAGTTCTVNDILITANNPLVLNVQGFTHIAHLQETAATIFNITPLEGG